MGKDPELCINIFFYARKRGENEEKIVWLANISRNHL